jgi:hypothetical protein
LTPKINHHSSHRGNKIQNHKGMSVVGQLWKVTNAGKDGCIAAYVKYFNCCGKWFWQFLKNLNIGLAV